jgi:DNA-binding GntR family transcriptional regulator
MKGFRPRQSASSVDRKPAADRVYTELRRRILHGVLPAGTLINEISTAAELDVSRTPVREALRELLSEGLVHEGARRQTVVAGASSELDREVRLMRIALESLAVREAAGRNTPSSTDMLRLTMIRTRRALAAGDINVALDCDDEFHVHIAQLADLPLIADTVRRLRGLTRLIGLARGRTLDELAVSAAEHEAIIDAIEAGDPGTAEQAVRQHLAR